MLPNTPIFGTHLDQQQRTGWYSWETLEAETEAREGVYLL